VTGVRVRMGTASWTDPTLIKEADFYPKRSMSAEERLRYYASIFPVVEVDATYYHPPTQDLAGLWVRRTPADFRMDIKAYSLFTQHPTAVKSLWDDVAEHLPPEREDEQSAYLSHLPDPAVDLAWEHFADALLPLHSAGKLGAVFFQFPPWFVPRRASREYLRELPQRLPEYQLAVEFRNRRWLAEPEDRRRTLELLEDAGLAYVCVDEPQGFASSVPPTLAVTADLAVLRFHGHNRENWQKKGITPAERFRYLYSEQELAEWAPRVQEVADQARETHVLFNNCYRDYGVTNARQLALLLGQGLQPGQASGDGDQGTLL
jgi:uncharacterized protein YecE (DUF72 family)